MRRNAGFTLIEVLVALTLGATVVLFTHASFGGARDLVSRLDSARAIRAREGMAHAFLVRAFGSLELTAPHGLGFSGGPDRIRFATGLDGRHAEPLRIELSDGWLVAALDTGTPLRLLPARAVVFDHLLTGGANSAWVAAWHSPASAPVAVRLRLQRADSSGVDTLLLLIGPRG